MILEHTSVHRIGHGSNSFSIQSRGVRSSKRRRSQLLLMKPRWSEDIAKIHKLKAWDAFSNRLEAVNAPLASSQSKGGDRSGGRQGFEVRSFLFD